VFWRGNDVFDPVKVGFVSDQPGGQFFRFDTAQPATATAATGRAYGTELPDDKAALVEFLKTF
jgi:hypothetical protein